MSEIMVRVSWVTLSYAISHEPATIWKYARSIRFSSQRPLRFANSYYIHSIVDFVMILLLMVHNTIHSLQRGTMLLFKFKIFKIL